MIKNETLEKAPIHGLLSREIRPIRNWHEWLQRWQAAVTMDEMIGLLHRGFEVDLGQVAFDEEKYDDEDRVLFYLGIADGWASYDILRSPDNVNAERREYRFGRDKNGSNLYISRVEARRMVATKAFDMLCLNFFKPELHICRGSDDPEVSWGEQVATEKLLPAIQSFFRIDSEILKRRIRNLTGRDDPSHTEKLAIDFLLSLSTFLWKWSEENIPSWESKKRQDEIKQRNLTKRSRLDAVKPWMVEVLSQLGQVSMLERWVLDLDQACLDKLEEIALREELSEFGYQRVVRETRLVATLDEACLAGSEAAWLLKHIELVKRESERLHKIIDAEDTVQKAQRTIKKLTPAGK